MSDLRWLARILNSYRLPPPPPARLSRRQGKPRFGDGGDDWDVIGRNDEILGNIITRYQNQPRPHIWVDWIERHPKVSPEEFGMRELHNIWGRELPRYYGQMHPRAPPQDIVGLSVIGAKKDLPLAESMGSMRLPTRNIPPAYTPDTAGPEIFRGQPLWRVPVGASLGLGAGYGYDRWQDSRSKPDQAWPQVPQPEEPMRYGGRTYYR